MIKLNIGCGADIREDYVNIDMHNGTEVGIRCGIELSKVRKIYNYDVCNLPFEYNSVDEILCLGFLEHLSFEDEGKFFNHVDFLLKPGGLFHFTVPDFFSLVWQWLSADDNFKEFYKVGTDEHWFGNNDRNIQNRWGYLTASIFGNQNGEGQFHRNAYTLEKIYRIMAMFNYRYEIEHFNFKDTEIKMIRCKAWKRC